MFNNVKLKRMLKKSFFPVLTQVNKFIPKNDKYILLYSANMGIRHNLKPIKDYLLENNYDKKYKIICGVENMTYAEGEERVVFTSPLKSLLYFFVTKHVFYTTGQIPIKPSKNQVVIQLDHGTTAIKTAGALSNINNGDDFYFTYYTVPSKIYIPIVKKEFLCDEKNIVINGEPVNDIFYKSFTKYDLGDFKKIGLWAPTFRQSDYLGYSDSEEELLPMFSANSYSELNNVLKELDIKLIVKLHSGQNVKGIEQFYYSNLEIYTDRDFNEKGYELYSLLQQTDFILADYSSVYLQYLLLDKSIAFVIPDIEEYKERRGFIFENVLDFMPGPKIMNKNDLYSYFKQIGNDIDNYKLERKKVLDIIHHYQDGDNSKRALEISGIYL